jgi:hypothetical protein
MLRGSTLRWLRISCRPMFALHLSTLRRINTARCVLLFELESAQRQLFKGANRSKEASHAPLAAMAHVTDQRDALTSVSNPPCTTTTPAAVQIPPDPGFCGLGARVEHVLARREDRLSSIVAEALQLPQVTEGTAEPGRMWYWEGS